MIKLLSQNLINQIAAGEVIERPASVIKELVENSIDAGSTEVEIKIEDAGKSLISVSDNGCGMDKDSLKLCILNHATSKLSDENLFDIHTFGFRGEALPSMVSIARVSITSSDNNDGEAWRINTEGKENYELELESRSKGTTVTVKDLFYATPARLKFLKSDTTENESCVQALKQLALAFKNVSFTLFDNGRKKLSYKASNNLRVRIQEIFGRDTTENLMELKVEKNKYSLYGFVGVPTFNKPTSNFQYLFINNRFVKDKIFSYALRSAYSGLLPQKRYPVAILFLDMPYEDVDVNAHPAKVEVRFKETETVRRFLISSLKDFITSSCCSSTPSTGIVNSICNSSANKASTHATQNNRTIQEYYASNLNGNGSNKGSNNGDKTQSYSGFTPSNFSFNKPEKPLSNNNFNCFANNNKSMELNFTDKPERSSHKPNHDLNLLKTSSLRSDTFTNFQESPEFIGASCPSSTDSPLESPLSPQSESSKLPESLALDREPTFPSDLLMELDQNLNEELGGIEQDISPTYTPTVCSEVGLNLGEALYQIANTYIIAANANDLIIVDQHAAAERITLEKLKKTTKLDSQDLLMPEVCSLTPTQVELFEKHIDLINKFGIVFDKLSSDVITIRALPAILGSCEAKPLIDDIAAELETMGGIYSLEEQIHLILSTISCHGSLRAGRKLSIQEMNSLLRQMESTENIAQCCHGRPSFVILNNKNLRNLFERT